MTEPDGFGNLTVKAFYNLVKRVEALEEVINRLSEVLNPSEDVDG